MSVTILIDGLSKERAADYLLRAPGHGTVDVIKEKDSLGRLYQVRATGLLERDVLAFLGCPQEGQR